LLILCVLFCFVLFVALHAWLSQKVDSMTSEFKDELNSLRADVERKQADLERFSSEKEQISQKATDARESVLKSQSDLRESEFAAQRYKEDAEKASSEVEQLKAQLAQKDTDLRNTLGSMQEFQRLASEEKCTLRAEISALQPRVFQLEEQRLANNSELAAKKEELLSMTRECSQMKETSEKMQATLALREREADEAKIAVMQLGVEKEMRLKSELREENERSERVAASAQLVATQTECEYRVREIEAQTQGQAKLLQDDIQKAKDQERTLHDENTTLQEKIADFEGQLSELNRALQHAEANHEAVTELSKVKGEVEMYKRRVTELERTKSSEGMNANSRIAELEADLIKRDIQRRKLHNLVQELRGNVRVFARVRPYLPNDGDISTLESPINTRSDASGLKITRLLKGPEDRPESHGFTFDKVFNPSTSQENVFEEVSEFVQSALDGYNVCLFSYGQTGSGKTHTMQGSGDGAMRGIIPRAIQQVGMYKLQLEEKGWEYIMEVSFIEIYNETIRVSE
jgi:kinesin family member C1